MVVVFYESKQLLFCDFTKLY